MPLLRERGSVSLEQTVLVCCIGIACVGATSGFGETLYETCETVVCAVQRLREPWTACTDHADRSSNPGEAFTDLNRAFSALQESRDNPKPAAPGSDDEVTRDNILAALLAGAGLTPGESVPRSRGSLFDDAAAHRVADGGHIATDAKLSSGPRDLHPNRPRVWDPGKDGEVRRGLFSYLVEDQTLMGRLELQRGNRSSLPENVAREPFAMSKGCLDGQSPCRVYSVAPFLTAECRAANQSAFECAVDRLREWVASSWGHDALNLGKPAPHDHPSWWRTVHLPVPRPAVTDPGWPGEIRSGRFATYLESLSLNDRLAVKGGSLLPPDGMAGEPFAMSWGCHLPYGECTIYSVAPYRCPDRTMSRAQCAEERLRRWAESEVGERSLIGHPPPPNHPTWRPPPEFFVFDAPPRPSHDASPRRPANLVVSAPADSSESIPPVHLGHYEAPLPPRRSTTIVASLPIRPRRPSPPAPRTVYASERGAVRRSTFAHFAESLPFPHLLIGLSRRILPLPDDFTEEAFAATAGCFDGRSQCRVYSVAKFDCGLKSLTQNDCAEKRIGEWARSPEGHALLHQRVPVRSDGRVRRGKLGRYVERLTVPQRRAFMRSTSAFEHEESVPIGMEPVTLLPGCFEVGAPCRVYSVAPYRTPDCRVRRVAAFQCARERLDLWEGSHYGQLALTGNPMPAGHESWWPPKVADPGTPGEVRSGLFANFMEQQPFSVHRPTRRVDQEDLPPHLALEPVVYDRDCYGLHTGCQAYSVAPYLSASCLLQGLRPFECAEKRIKEWATSADGQVALAGDPLPLDHPSWRLASQATPWEHGWLELPP